VFLFRVSALTTEITLKKNFPDPLTELLKGIELKKRGKEMNNNKKIQKGGETFEMKLETDEDNIRKLFIKYKNINNVVYQT